MNTTTTPQPIPPPNRRQTLALLTCAGSTAYSASYIALTPAWAQATANPASTARITGTGSGLGGMLLLAQAFMRANPGTQIDVLPALGTTGGIRALVDSRIDLSISNRVPTEAETAAGALQHKAYARTPFVLAAHRDLGVVALTGAQLVDLYNHPAPTFPNGKSARPVLRTSDITDTRLLKEFVPSLGIALAAAIDAAASRKGRLDAANDTDCADLIEHTPGAFGPSTLALMTTEKRPLVAISVDGVAPTLANLVTGSYPHGKTMVLVQSAKSSPVAQRFAAYVMGADAQRILQGAGHAAA